MRGCERGGVNLSEGGWAEGEGVREGEWAEGG